MDNWIYLVDDRPGSEGHAKTNNHRAASRLIDTGMRVVDKKEYQRVKRLCERLDGEVARKEGKA